MFPFATARKSAGTIAAPRAIDLGLLAQAPGLRDASERIVVSVVKGLQTMAGPATTVEGMLAGFVLDRAREVVGSHQPHMSVGAVVLKETSQSLLVTLDAMLVHGLVELLCGGNGAEAPAVTPRATTPIDQQFTMIVVTLVAAAIQSEWASHGFGPTRAGKLDAPLPNDILGAKNDDVGVINITIGIFGLHGTLRLVLPRAVLDRFTPGTHDPQVQADSTDPDWARSLQQELGRTPVALAAYLDAKEIPLSSIAGLKVGQVLALPADARSRAALVSDGRVLYRGEIGREDSRYSLRIDEIVSEPADVAQIASRRSQYFEISKAP